MTAPHRLTAPDKRKPARAQPRARPAPAASTSAEPTGPGSRLPWSARFAVLSDTHLAPAGAPDRCLCYSGGHVLYSQTAGNSATFKFTGNLIQFVSERGSTRGSFKVYINGALKATVSNYITTPNQNAVIVWQESFASVATRTLKIVVVGTSGHPRVDVDAFVVAT